MGFWEWLLGPRRDTSKGDYEVRGDIATVNEGAISPDDRSTPGLYYSGDLVRAAESNGLAINKEIVTEAKRMADTMEKNEENMKEFATQVKRLAKHEAGTVRYFSGLKPRVAQYHAKQFDSHNKQLAGMDYAASNYQKSRQKRLTSAEKVRANLSTFTIQSQQVRKQLRG
ncbi:MAG: hypothetical protein WBA13_01245 [Microcoleaceae cyanobacterium]